MSEGILERLRAVNVSRLEHWHAGGEEWTGADWSNAMGGEAGEAQNVVKKLRRIETGLWDAQKYPGDSTHSRGLATDGERARGELLHALGRELADVVIYADLLAYHYALWLPDEIKAKFNDVSIAQGFPERLT